MSVVDPTSIDFLAIESADAKIILAVSDHLPWSQPLEHIYALQEKLNTYAAFVETGQVWDAASEQIGREIQPGSMEIQVKVFLEWSAPPLFFEFMERARTALEAIGMSLAHQVRPEE